MRLPKVVPIYDDDHLTTGFTTSELEKGYEFRRKFPKIRFKYNNVGREEMVRDKSKFDSDVLINISRRIYLLLTN